MTIKQHLYSTFTGLSPQIEVFLRKIYWNNVRLLHKFRLPILHSNKTERLIDFEKIKRFLTNNGVNENDILIIHSSYDSFSGNGLDANSIIDKLMEIVPQGTIAMPAIRKFEEEGDYLDYITKDYSDINTFYDVWNSPLISGLLPFVLMRYDDAYISRCPLNPLVAVGKDAENMMKGNIENDFITPHGKGSCWEYCAKNNAWNIGLGVDLKGFLTIYHVFQEANEWPVTKWFFERKFTIKDGKYINNIIVNERCHKWTKYLAENNFYKDLIEAQVIITGNIEGIQIFMSQTNKLSEFIKNHPNKTYPYYIPSSHY